MSSHLKTIVTSLAVAGSFASGSAARADLPVALTTQSPIAITACDLGHRFDIQTPYGYTQLQTVSGLNVSFENRRAVAANQVDLQVRYGGRSALIVDRGTFAPSTTIKHAFDSFDGTSFASDAPNQCRVVAVHYADGSVWQAHDGTSIARMLPRK